METRPAFCAAPIGEGRGLSPLSQAGSGAYDGAMTQPTRRSDPRQDEARDAQALLDQLRHEAGGALTGAEARARAGLDPEEVDPDPPLDWRMTPRNILLNLLAIAVFVAAAAFLILLVFDGWSAILGRGSGGAP